MLSHWSPSLYLPMTTKHGIKFSRFSMALAAFATHAPLESRKAPLRNAFAYPEHDNPTPQQIFHLPFGATQKQIKSRCTSTLLSFNRKIKIISTFFLIQIMNSSE